MKKIQYIILVFSLLFISRISLGQNNKNSENTNFKFYLTDAKQTPLKNIKITFAEQRIVTDPKSGKRNVATRDYTSINTDLFGNLSLSEKIIPKSKMNEDLFCLHFKLNDPIFDTVSSVILFDKEKSSKKVLKRMNNDGYFKYTFKDKKNIQQDTVININNNTNLKFYLTDAKQTPVSSQEILLVSTNDIPSFKFLTNFKNNNTIDKFGNYSLSEQLIKKSDLQKSWSLIIEASKKLDTISTIIVFDKDEKKEYHIRKDSMNRFVFDFGRVKKETTSKNKIKSTELKLTETETKKPISNQKVIYSDATGLKQNTSTNTEGIFTVQNISTENFEIELEKNATLDQIINIVVSTKQGEKVSELKKNNEGTFKYTFLPNELAVLSEIENSDTQLNIIKSTELKLTEAETQKPISNQKVIYNDADGKKQNTSTNNEGVFKVANISEKNFAIELEKSENLNSISSIRVSNKQGITITEIKKNNQTSFEYTFLPSDFIKLTKINNDAINTIKSTELKLTDTETKKPISNQKVMYNDVDGKKQNTSTNTDGIFIVENVSTENLQLELENNEKLKSIIKISISTKQGDKISEMQKSAEGTFKYTFLKSELSVLKELSNNDDIALKVNSFKNNDNKELKIKKQIYFELTSAELSSSAKNELDDISQILNENPTLQLEIIAHTDARGDDVTNLTLSEKRAANSVNYLISKGIKTERLKSKGMGEKEILNRCTNNITCSELEHALNRRTEFKFLKN